MGVAEQAGGLFGFPGFATGNVFVVEDGVGGPGTLLVYRDYRDDMGNKSAYLHELCVQPPGSPNDRVCVDAREGANGGFSTKTATKLDDNCTSIEDAGYFRVPAFDSNNRDVSLDGALANASATSLLKHHEEDAIGRAPGPLPLPAAGARRAARSHVTREEPVVVGALDVITQFYHHYSSITLLLSRPHHERGTTECMMLICSFCLLSYC